MGYLRVTREENKLLAAQLQKDFARANIPIGIPTDGEPNPEDLYRSIHEKIYVLLMEDFDAYLNLMYIIDIPERDFEKIELTDAVTVAKQMADRVIDRELQKVRFKKRHSPPLKNTP